MESWKVNLISVWFGCFFTGLAISQILPFLPLYVSQLGVTSHEALSMWSGLTFSVTFLVSAIVSPMWGSLADRKGRKLMLLRASLGMAIAILLQAFATNVWQLFILRAVMGLTSGYIPNAMALVASQVPRERSGWALSTLSTAQISGVIGGPLLGGFLADHVGLRAVFIITAILLTVSFLVTLFLIKEGRRVRRVGMHHAAEARIATIQRQVRGGIGRRTIAPLHHLTLEIDYHHIVRFHGLIGDAAGLNRHQPTFTVDGADVTPGKSDQSVTRQIHISVKDLLF